MGVRQGVSRLEVYEARVAESGRSRLSAKRRAREKRSTAVRARIAVLSSTLLLASACGSAAVSTETPRAPASSSSSPTAGPTPSALPAPALCGSGDLEPSSVTAISEKEWWVLVEPCDNVVSHFGGGAGVFAIEHTTDGGITFTSSSVPADATASDVQPQMRFADESNGWLFGPLWATHDGGHHWHPVSVDVVQLEPGADGWVFAVTSQCIDAYHCSDELRRAQAGSDNWSRVLAIPHRLPDDRFVIGVHGRTLWVIDLTAFQGALWVSYDAGDTFTSRTYPCPPINQGSDQIDPVSDTVVWAYCTDMSGGRPLVSTDSGRTWHPTNFSGTNSGVIAGISAQTAFVTAQSTALAGTTDGGATFKRILDWASTAAWVGFTDSRVGYAIVSPQEQSLTEPWRTQLWRTTDGGLHWAVVQLNGSGT